MSARILIVEDEEPLTMLLVYNLEKEGYEVDTAARGDDADTKLKESTPDLVVLDWMLPGLSGIELCRRLRARPETQQLPIIMLTARGEESEKVRGLATGADDYIVKPFSVPELLARVRALLRRANPERVATILNIGDIELDRDKKRVTRSGRAVDLGPTEYRLLEFLMERPGRVFSREQLLDGVWGSEIYIDERTVDVHVGRLRKALNRGHEGRPDPHRARRRLRARRPVSAGERSTSEEYCSAFQPPVLSCRLALGACAPRGVGQRAGCAHAFAGRAQGRQRSACLSSPRRGIRKQNKNGREIPATPKSISKATQFRNGGRLTRRRSEAGWKATRQWKVQ